MPSPRGAHPILNPRVHQRSSHSSSEAAEGDDHQTICHGPLTTLTVASLHASSRCGSGGSHPGRQCLHRPSLMHWQHGPCWPSGCSEWYHLCNSRSSAIHLFCSYLQAFSFSTAREPGTWRLWHPCSVTTLIWCQMMSWCDSRYEWLSWVGWLRTYSTINCHG